MALPALRLPCPRPAVATSCLQQRHFSRESNCAEGADSQCALRGLSTGWASHRSHGPGQTPDIILPAAWRGTQCPGCTPVPDRNRMPSAVRWQPVGLEQRSSEQGSSSLVSPGQKGGHGPRRPSSSRSLCWRQTPAAPQKLPGCRSLTRNHSNDRACTRGFTCSRRAPVVPPAHPRHPGHCPVTGAPGLVTASPVSGPVPGK